MTKNTTVFVVSAPSGAGKRTILRKVREKDDALEYVVSATTRSPRHGEVDGREYFFLDEQEFGRRVDAGDFLEWAKVHGHLYGILREELDRRLATGHDVILELDVQGMRSMKKAWPEAITIFITASSVAELEARLRKRGANDPDDMALRLENARAEMEARHAFDYIIVNEVLEEAVADFEAIVRAERRRSKRQP